VKGLAQNRLGNLEFRDVLRKPTLALKLRFGKDDIEEFRRRLQGYNSRFSLLLHSVEL